jgi:hypothetical protein
MNSHNSNLKPQQLAILLLLYKYRFLNRIQIQTMLNHKHFNRIIVWLNDLVKKQYLTRYFTRKFGAKPAVYCLDTKSRKVLMHQKNIKVNLLNRIYKEKTRTLTFQKHCLFLADIYLSLLKLTLNNKAELHFYTKTDLYGMHYLVLPNPDAYFAIVESNKNTKRYFLDIFDDLPPRMVLRKRVKQYFNYYSEEYWQNNTNKPFPEIILVCPDERSKKYLHKNILEKLDEEMVELTFYLTTWNDIKIKGFNRGVLEKVEI